MKISIEAGEVILSEVYSGVGIVTDMGLFGIAQRDGGIEVMLDGKTVWTSNEITTESERMVPGELRADVLASGVLTGSRVSEAIRLPDGSGAFVASYPLPKTHWLYSEEPNEPPAFMRMGIGAKRAELALQIAAAARYAVRGATMRGREKDFDPDALVQNMVVGLLGYWTEDGRSGRDLSEDAAMRDDREGDPEKRFKISKVEAIGDVHGSGKPGWHLEFDTRWTSIPSSLCDVAPQVGEEVVFTSPVGCDRSQVTVGGRLYLHSYPDKVGET